MGVGVHVLAGSAVTARVKSLAMCGSHKVRVTWTEDGRERTFEPPWTYKEVRGQNRVLVFGDLPREIKREIEVFVLGKIAREEI